jgi:hypothetical protein
MFTDGTYRVPYVCISAVQNFVVLLIDFIKHDKFFVLIST